MYPNSTTAYTVTNHYVERARGFEPRLSEWKSLVLPLHHAGNKSILQCFNKHIHFEVSLSNMKRAYGENRTRYDHTGNVTSDLLTSYA